MSLNNLKPGNINPFPNLELNQNQVGPGIHCQYLDNLSFQFIFTGTPTGTFGLNVCNDATLETNGTITGGTWVPLVLSLPQIPSASGGAGSCVIEYNQTGMAFIQATYTYTSGDGYAICSLSAHSV